MNDFDIAIQNLKDLTAKIFIKIIGILLFCGLIYVFLIVTFMYLNALTEFLKFLGVI
jgi:hypothetical protein